MKTKPPNPLRRCRTRATRGGWGGHSGRRKRSGLRFAQRPSLAPGEGGPLHTPQKSIRRRIFAHAKTTTADRFHAGALTARLAPAPGGGRQNWRSVWSRRYGRHPNPARGAQPGSQIPDSRFRDSDAQLHKTPRRQMGRGGRTSILQSTNPAADIEERYSSGVTQPSAPNTRTVRKRTFGEEVARKQLDGFAHRLSWPRMNWKGARARPPPGRGRSGSPSPSWRRAPAPAPPSRIVSSARLTPPPRIVSCSLRKRRRCRAR